MTSLYIRVLYIQTYCLLLRLETIFPKLFRFSTPVNANLLMMFSTVNGKVRTTNVSGLEPIWIQHHFKLIFILKDFSVFPFLYICGLAKRLKEHHTDYETTWDVFTVFVLSELHIKDYLKQAFPEGYGRTVQERESVLMSVYNYFFLPQRSCFVEGKLTLEGKYTLELLLLHFFSLLN